MNQLTIFDITPQPLPETPPKATVTEDATPVTDNQETATENPLIFPYTIPDSPDITSILGIGDRVLILPAKYDLKPNAPGIVKAFVLGGVVVQRRDGEGLYQRKELHRIPPEK
jgi:hypothetical protein